MQIGKRERGLNRPSTRFPPPRKMNLEKVSIEDVFTGIPSVPFDLNPDKESLSKPSNFCQKPRGLKQTAETARRLLCKLKLPINFQTHPPTHSLTCWQRHKLSKRIFRPAASMTGFSNHFSVTELLDFSTTFLSSLPSPPRIYFLFDMHVVDSL